MAETAIPAFVPEELKRLEIELDDARLAKLARYLELLLEVNEQFNLTAIRERDAAWRRHIIDSLTVLSGLEGMHGGTTLIDVGSGGGLPGVPIAIARPDVKVTLLEATGKKANFLQRCIDELPLPNARVVNDRAENAGQDKAHRQAYDAVVCRAIGPMREILEYTLPLLCVGGLLLAMKGPKAEQELSEAADALDVLGAGDLKVFEAYPEGSEQNTVIVSIIKERPTPREYPRKPGVPRQTPL
jgi:16S rRNA (guanine527-N7)-methyltransferase